MSREQALLSVRDLRVHFRSDAGLVRAVDGVSFDVHPGEVLGLVGESGSGKTVVNLAVLGLLPTPPGFLPSGEIWFQGRDLARASEGELRRVRGNRIAMIFQDPMTALNPYLTVGVQLSEVLETHRRMTRSEARARGAAMLARVGIADPERRLDGYPHELSGGMRQRVMIAMALLCEPCLLIADEPTTAVDVTIQAQILRLIAALQAESRMSVILITHDLGVVAGTAHRVAVMYAGRIVESAQTEELFQNPRHPYTQGLLRSVPRLFAPSHEALVPIAGLPPDLSRVPSGCPFHPRCPRAMPCCAEAYPEPSAPAPDHVVSCFASAMGFP